MEKLCALPQYLFIPTCKSFYTCTFCSIVKYFTNISKRSIWMYVLERLENWKNYVPAARALANVIKWYTEPMQQRTRDASKYCRFYIESIFVLPWQHWFRFTVDLVIWNPFFLWHFVFPVWQQLKTICASHSVRADENQRLLCKTTNADERNWLVFITVY